MRRRQFMGLGAALGATLLGARSARACLWDSDTFEQEVQGVPDVVVVLIGGFARNPGKYYAMRLARVEAELGERPDELALYDDAAVACDRLGESDQAIAWMTRKREALLRLGISRADVRGQAPNHWYRYNANLGTFFAHRWLRGGAHWAQRDELERAHDCVARAIEDNPEAHFGREKYQLRALAWLLERPTYKQNPERESHVDMLPTFVEVEPRWLDNLGSNEAIDSRGLADAIAGLCGLITLGAAWDSFDVTAALAYLLAADGRQSVAELARFRCAEILRAGGRTLVRNAPEGEALLELLPHGLGAFGEREYAELRDKAKRWARRRADYLQSRLTRGEHPDTHPEFWAGFGGDPQHMEFASLGLEVSPAEAEAEAERRSGRGSSCRCSSSTDAGGPLALGAALLAALRARGCGQS